MIRYDYRMPRTLDEAWDLAETLPEPRFAAGGTDIMVAVKNGAARPGALISLRGIGGLEGIEVGDRIRIGATTTIADLLGHRELCERLPLLAEAARRMGSAQIRNAATVGGNLCNASPCADAACALLAMDATVRLRRRGGERDVPLGSFFTGPKETCAAPGEILTDVLVDPPPPGAGSAFLKRGRVRMDMAIASVGALVDLDGGVCRFARIAAGSLAPTPIRLSAVEDLLEGAELTADLIAKARRLAEEGVSPITDVRSTAEFRKNLAGVYTERALARIAEGRAS